MQNTSKVTYTRSKPAIETLEKGVKYVKVKIKKSQ